MSGRELGYAASSASAVLLNSASLVEQGWCRDASAQDAQGRSCAPCDVHAVRWSVSGALERAAGALALPRETDRAAALAVAIAALRSQAGWRALSAWNADPACSGFEAARCMRRAAHRVLRGA